jgi:hemerythrin
MSISAPFGRIQLQQQAINNLIQWGDHLSVDHPMIDIQHKAIFDLGTRVYENWKSGGSLDVLFPAMDKLANLLQAHFAYEERVLAEIGYDELKEHAAEHRCMLDEIEMLRDGFRGCRGDLEVRRGSVLAPGWSVMQFILGFTIGHVSTSDMSYCQTLKASRDVALKVA